MATTATAPSLAAIPTAKNAPKQLPAPNSDFYQLCAGTEDKKEGTTAFLEKRAPRFQGR
jgi:1,4-dihydroxy-2-naphthoyl-CoA synthase